MLFTDEMINKMNEKSKWKNTNSKVGKRKYRELNNQFRRGIKTWMVLD